MEYKDKILSIISEEDEDFDEETGEDEADGDEEY